MKLSNVNRRSSERPAYKPDLDELLSQCELNYCLLMRLRPDLLDISRDNARINVKSLNWSTSARLVSLSFRVTDFAKYTTTMNLIIKSPQINLTKGIELIVRAYHDAKMLEVMEGSGPSALMAIHKISNHPTKPVDEKRQINRFVGESLTACLNLNNSKCGIS